MTFNDMLDIFKREIVSDRSEDVWTASGEILPMLKNASVEIAAMLGFPQAIGTQALSDGATEIPAPTDMLAAQLGQVIIGEWDVRPGTYVEVMRQRARSSGVPVVYNYDPRRSGGIAFGPSLSGTATATFEYTKELDASAIADSAEAWEGRFPQWHWLIPVRAGINGWRMVQNYERAQFYLQEFTVGYASFASFLGVPADQIVIQQLDQTVRRDTADGS